MATGKRCAVLAVGSLVELWGESVEVRKSQVDGKKYPLYLSTKTGPVPFNTPKAQEFLLNFADFDGPEPMPEAANDSGPVLVSVSEPNPEPSTPAPESAPDFQRKKQGFLSWIGDLSDG